MPLARGASVDDTTVTRLAHGPVYEKCRSNSFRHFESRLSSGHQGVKTTVVHKVTDHNYIHATHYTQSQVRLEPAQSQGEIVDRCGNDPSAGSPTETLLRLHLPLNDKV